MPRALRPDRLVAPALTLLAFLAAAGAFFAIIGQPPLRTLGDLWQFAMGDAFSRRETLIKTAPILLCALATAIPGRLGLISVGAEGQLHAGAIAGTAVVLFQQDLPAALLLPAMRGAAILRSLRAVSSRRRIMISYAMRGCRGFMAPVATSSNAPPMC